MYGKLALSVALALISTLAWAAPLKVDLSANGAVEPGWFDWNTGGRADNANFEKRFQNQVDFDDDFTIRFTKVDSRNRAQMNDAIPLHDLLEDAFKESDPFTMTIVGLAPGTYTMTTYDHDTNEDVVNDDGTLNITLKDADGTRLVANHVQQSWGPKPASVCSVTFTFRSDGSDVVLTFADNNDGIHNEAYLNGFILDRAVEPTKASAPQPADKTADVPRNVTLRWTAAETAAAANGHKVYLSKSLDDVKNGVAAADRGSTTDPAFDTLSLPASLEFGTTYYWRVDEGDAAKGYAAGTVWSFTTEPYAYPIPGKAITATASSSLNDKATPSKTIDGSGLDTSDLHSTNDADMWLAGGSQPTWLEYRFDKIYSLHEMWVWNYNQTVEPIVGFGLKEAAIEYSLDGASWTPLAPSTQFARGSGAAGYAHNTTVAFGGVPAKFVRITAKSSWGGGAQYGLSEVRFYYVPVQAREPQPGSNAAGIGPEVTLGWRAGRRAASHSVYLSTDLTAVQNATAPVTHPTTASLDAGTLSLATTYYWRVDEVNAADASAVWAGDVWSFATPEFVLVDDFESYTDAEGKRIYETWIDGYADGFKSSGSTVGKDTALNGTFGETQIIHGGKQSMPLLYNNTTAAFSEATRTFDAPQDWTRAGIKALAVHFRGEPNNTGGRVYVKINNAKVVYGGDAGDIAKSRWMQWNIDLGSLGGSLRNVTKLSIGVEGAGKGRGYVDDLRLYPSRCVAGLNHLEGDLNNDCVVDYRDIDIMANDWLKSDSTLVTSPAAPSTTGLLAHYKLDGNVLDSSGNNLNGTISGNPAYTPGIFGQAMTFDGIGDYVDCTNNVKFDTITNSITVCAWVRVDVFDVTYQPIVTKGDSSWRIARNAETNGIQWRANGPTPTFRINGTANVNDGEWHHLAGTYDGATAQLFVDGKLDGALATAGAIAKNTQKVFIGGNSEQTARLWKGAIDDVWVYSRALTEAEVRYLADQTPGDGKLYVPLMSPAELYRAEPVNQKSVNLKDFAQLAKEWLNTQLWP
jgi:hypothetical protein